MPYFRFCSSIDRKWHDRFFHFSRVWQQREMMATCSHIFCCVAILILSTTAFSPAASSEVNLIRGAAGLNKLPSPYQEGFQRLANRKRWSKTRIIISCIFWNTKYSLWKLSQNMIGCLALSVTFHKLIGWC